MDISVSINSKLNDEYRIILSPFNLDIIPCEVQELLGDDIEIVDVTLERVKGINPTRYWNIAKDFKHHWGNS